MRDRPKRLWDGGGNGVLLGVSVQDATLHTCRPQALGVRLGTTPNLVRRSATFLWGCATPVRYVSTNTCVSTTTTVYEVRKLFISRCLTKGTQAKNINNTWYVVPDAIHTPYKCRLKHHQLYMRSEKTNEQEFRKLDGVPPWHLVSTYLLQMKIYTSIGGEHNRDLSFSHVVLVGSQGFDRSCTYRCVLGMV